MLFADWIDGEPEGGFMLNPLVLVPLILALLGLVGLMIFLRTRKKNEDGE